MQIGVVGLGRMGASIVGRLQRGGHQCVVWDIDASASARAAGQGATGASDLADLVRKLAPPRAVWVMLPHGEPTEKTILALSAVLQKGDTILDGGNSHFHDDVRRARELAVRGIRYLDVGTSGGVRGGERGYCLMIGGDKDAAVHLDPIFATLAPGIGDIPRTPVRTGAVGSAEQGYLYCGPAGAGHFVKMIHNGIEYGMMQAFAEGFEILKGAAGSRVPEERRYELPLADIAEVWRRGSVVSSWLLDLLAESLVEDPTLGRFSGKVDDSGEGRWTVQTAIEEGVPATVLTAALYTRFRSRADKSFAEQTLSALRAKFGGHREAG
jgi:6-phosphogluconate dehydrogenase